MPSTSPRTSGVLPTYAQPPTNSRQRLDCLARRSTVRPLISLMPKNTVNAVARKVSALKYSARCVGLTALWPVDWCTELTTVVSPARIAPASTGVTP